MLGRTNPDLKHVHSENASVATCCDLLLVQVDLEEEILVSEYTTGDRLLICESAGSNI